MTVIDENHPLAQYLEGVAELEELLNAYNIVSTDDVLRNAVTYDARPLIVHGSSKRLALAVKKVQPIISTLEDGAKPPYTKGVETKELQVFINSLRVSQPVTKEEDLKHTPDGVIQVGASTENESSTGTFQVPTVEEETATQAEAVTEESNLDSSDLVTHKSPQAGSGLCQYGVLMIPVEYQEPNVLGLKESLVDSIDEDSIKEFFRSFSKRVANSTNI